MATLNWTQTLIRQATHQLTLDAFISRQWSNSITAPLTAASEQATRSSPGGFILHKLDFRYNQKDFPVDSTLILHILDSTANHRIGITDPKNTGPVHRPCQLRHLLLGVSGRRRPGGLGRRRRR